LTALESAGHELKHVVGLAKPHTKELGQTFSPRIVALFLYQIYLTAPLPHSLTQSLTPSLPPSLPGFLPPSLSSCRRVRCRILSRLICATRIKVQFSVYREV
jgi:hypothetical protein